MPPLCTAGYGFAMGNTSYFFGAFYLYFINTVFIAFTTCIGVRLLHFHRKKFVDREKMKRVNYYIISIVIITMLPAGYMTWSIIKQSVTENNVEKFVRDELNNNGTYIISYEYDSKTKTLNVVAIGKPISVGAIAKAQKSMADYKLGDYTLKVIQGASSDSLLAIQRNKKGLAVTGEGNSSKWQEQAYQNVALQKQLAAYTRYPVLANDMKRELKVVCPAAKSLVLSQSSECFLDTALTKDMLWQWLKPTIRLPKMIGNSFMNGSRRE